MFFVVGRLVVITPFISPKVIKLESSYLIHTGIWASCINLSKGQIDALVAHIFFILGPLSILETDEIEVIER